MKFENFLGELATLKDERDEICEQIKSHGLPVIIYGAAQWAGFITDELTARGVDVAGYAVDPEYFKPDKTYLNRPVYNFAELRAQPEKYVFVLGMVGTSTSLNAFRFLCDEKIIRYGLLPRSVLSSDLTGDYILNERDKFSETFDMLEDDLSRETMLAYLRLEITGNQFWNAKVYRNNEYFNELTAAAIDGERCFVDCGAYRGDTVEEFIRWSGGRYKKIFAFEPDAENFNALEKNFGGREEISLFHCGVYDRKTFLAFDSSGNMDSNFNANGAEKIPVEKIDDIVGEEPVSLIKMDIEGSELPALHGAATTIKRDKPFLAICAYHKAKDLITLPQFIKNLCNDYKFHLRKHTASSNVSLILYATI